MKLVAANSKPPPWPDPDLIPKVEFDLPPFERSLVPQPLKTWVFSISERTQVDPSLAITPALTSIASLLGRKLGVYPKRLDPWFVVPNLWGAIVARPGYFKSPIIAEVMKPIQKLNQTATEEFERKSQRASCHSEILKVRLDALKDRIKKAAKKGDEDQIIMLRDDFSRLVAEAEKEAPVQRRYFTNDATVEKLGVIMRENPNGILLLRDELHGWLSSLRKAGREGEREFYLEAWNGSSSFTVDRIGRGTIQIPHLCLSIFGGIQPSKVEAFVSSVLKGGEEDDGLIQRFQLLVFPEMPRSWRNVDRRLNEEEAKRIEELFLRIDGFDPAKTKGDLDSRSDNELGLTFDLNAQLKFDIWRQSLEERLRSGDIKVPAFESHLAKYRSLIPSLALVFHVITDLAGTDGTSLTKAKISGSTMELALKWGEYLEAHARKIYGIGVDQDLVIAKKLAAKIERRHVRCGDTLRSIYRHHWSGLDTIQKLERGVAYLEKLNWVRVERRPVGTTWSEHLLINPKLSGGETHGV